MLLADRRRALSPGWIGGSSVCPKFVPVSNRGAPFQGRVPHFSRLSREVGIFDLNECGKNEDLTLGPDLNHAA